MTDPQTHELKTWPDFFQPLLNGWKTFEIRRDDRGFRVHHILRLREWNPTAKKYTGREICKRVTYVLGGSMWGLMPNYVVMGLADAEPKEDCQECSNYRALKAPVCLCCRKDLS